MRHSLRYSHSAAEIHLRFSSTSFVICPVPQFNAATSYGVGFIDSGDPGVIGQGTTRMAHNRRGSNSLSLVVTI
ncbi:hypothetical protein EDD15DRAFT_2316776 [Pisolithus albus]|nr:hypothetical protein EDD15DRAFT_2316776 [Pisolithus albus]